MRLYRAALWLYPLRFRREYGADMVALVEEQLRDEPVWRVAGRTLLDLLVTIPTRHLEARMPRSTTTPLVVALVSVAAGSAVLGGPVGLAGAAALLGLAALVWRRSRPLVVAPDGRWWKTLAAGVVLLVLLVIVTTITGELPSGGWYLAMATMLTSFGLIAAGAVGGITSRFRSARHMS